MAEAKGSKVANSVMGERLAAALRASGDYIEVAGQLVCADCGMGCGAGHTIHCDDNRKQRIQLERLERLRELGGSAFTPRQQGGSHGRY